MFATVPTQDYSRCARCSAVLPDPRTQCARIHQLIIMGVWTHQIQARGMSCRCASRRTASCAADGCSHAGSTAGTSTARSSTFCHRPRQYLCSAATAGPKCQRSHRHKKGGQLHQHVAKLKEGPWLWAADLQPFLVGAFIDHALKQRSYADLPAPHSHISMTTGMHP